MMYFTEKDYEITAAWALQERTSGLWKTRSICLGVEQVFSWVERGDDYRAVGLGGSTLVFNSPTP